MQKGIEQLQKLTNRIQELQVNLGECVNQAKKSEEDLKNQAQTLKQEITEFQDHIAKLDTQIRETTEKSANLEKELASLEQGVKEFEEKLTSIKNQISDAEKSNNSLKNELASAKGAFDKTAEVKSRLEREVEKLRQECSVLDKQIGERTWAIGTAETQRESLAQQLASMAEEYKKIQGLASQNITTVHVLRTYMALYRKVYAKKPHVRALALLHGPKAEWNTEELAKTLAVGAEVVEECIEDLKRAELVVWDEKGENVKLLTRLF